MQKEDNNFAEIFNESNIYMCLMDLSAEAKRVIESKGTSSFDKNYRVYSQLDEAIKSHRDMSDGLLWELEQERQFFDNYLQQKNDWFNDESILAWYNQWLYDLNFAEMFN